MCKRMHEMHDTVTRTRPRSRGGTLSAAEGESRGEGSVSRMLLTPR